MNFTSTRFSHQHSRSRKLLQPTGLAHNIPTRDIPPSLASLELLRKYGSGFKKLKGVIILSDESSAETPALLGHRLSTGEIMEMAGARYVQYPTQMHDDYLMPVHPFGFALSGDLSRDEKRDWELAHLFEKVQTQDF